MSTPLFRHATLAEALWDEDIESAGLLVLIGADVNKVHEVEPGATVTLLEVLAVKQKYRAVEFLLQKGADPNRRCESGQTALFQPAANGDERMVTLLLTYEANPNIRENRRGDVALHFAAMEGHVGVVKALVGFGAEPHPANAKGITPLMLAMQSGHRAVVELLGSGNAAALLRQHFEAARGIRPR